MKNIKTKIILITLFTVFTLVKPVSVYAWDDCPKGKVNDPYPGDCARYIDTDGNGICDHSEPAPEDRVENTVEPEPDKAPVTTETTPTKEPTKQVASANTTVTKSNSNSNESSKTPLALGITAAHLVGIVAYITYKNKTAKKAYEKN